jgi:hypothetical protein
MALPVSLSGLATTEQSCLVGPFKSSGGNYYFIGKGTANLITLRAFKATDPTSAFSNVGTDFSVTGEPTPDVGIEQVSAWQDGDTIHVATAAESTVGSSDTDYAYHTFSMSSDSWTLTNEAIATGVDNNASGSGIYRAISICKRSSSGEIVVVYSGPQATPSMTAYARIVGKRRTGVGTWSSSFVADMSAANNAFDYICPVCVADPNNDRVIFGGLQRAGGLAFIGTLSSGNTAAVSATTLSTTIAPAIAPLVSGLVNLLAYDAAGTTKVILTVEGSTAGTIRIGYANAADTPTMTAVSLATSGDYPHRLFVDDTDDAWMLYRNTSDSDLYVRRSTDHGANWAATGPTNAFTSTVAADGLLSNNGRISYTQGGNYVLGYVVNDGGTLKYNQYSIRAAGTSYSVTGGITAGAIPIVGATVATKAVRSITVTAGALPITGATVTPRYGRTVSITPASIPIAGATVTPVFAKRIAVTAGAIPITGATVTPVHEGGGTDYSITVTAGAIPITGAAVAPVFAKTIAITAGALPITGATVAPVFAKRITVTAGSLPITGATVTPVKARSIAVTAGALPITGASVAPVFAKTIAVTPASLPITGAAVDTVYSGGTDYTITVTAGSLPITGALVAPVFAKAIAVTPASLPIAGATVAPVHARSIAVTPASIPIAGANVVPFKTGGSTDYTLTIEPGSLPIAGAAVVPVHSAASEQISHVVGVQVPGGPTPRKALREAAERLRKRREEATTQTAIKAADKALAAVAKAETLVAATATADDPSKPVTDALGGLERVLMTFREQSTSRALREWTARVEAQASALQREIDDEEEVLMLLLAA